MRAHLFKDLWPLSPDAEERRSRAVRAGDLSESDAENLRTFADRGHLLLPGAIEEALVDDLVKDVRNLGAHPGRFITTDHRNGRAQRLSDADFDSYESIFDTYVNLESARRVCFHPVVVRFLEACFEGRVVATQQLLFQRSNQHPIHQDTSVVCVEEPLLMVATWIALEDVVQGRGELTYYEGSHRIPHRLFADGTKRLNPEVDDAVEARRYLLEQCERLGCEKRDFIARKGDVLFWAADLVHASNPRTRPDEETRMSLVTHYCPETTEPFWFRFHRRNRGYQAFERVKYASMYYELPTRERMARPSFRIADS